MIRTAVALLVLFVVWRYAAQRGRELDRARRRMSELERRVLELESPLRTRPTIRETPQPERRRAKVLNLRSRALHAVMLSALLGSVPAGAASLDVVWHDPGSTLAERYELTITQDGTTRTVALTPTPAPSYGAATFVDRVDVTPSSPLEVAVVSYNGTHSATSEVVSVTPAEFDLVAECHGYDVNGSGAVDLADALETTRAAATTCVGVLTAGVPR